MRWRREAVTSGWSLGTMTMYSQHCLAHNQLRDWRCSRMVFKVLVITLTCTIKAMVANCFVISLSTIMKFPFQVRVSGCMGNTHTICYQTTFLDGSNELNLVSKKDVSDRIHTVA